MDEQIKKYAGKPLTFHGLGTLGHTDEQEQHMLTPTLVSFYINVQVMAND